MVRYYIAYRFGQVIGTYLKNSRGFSGDTKSLTGAIIKNSHQY